MAEEYLLITEPGVAAMIYSRSGDRAEGIVTLRVVQTGDGLGVRILPLLPVLLASMACPVADLPAGITLKVSDLPAEEQSALHDLCREYESALQDSRAKRAGLVFA